MQKWMIGILLALLPVVSYFLQYYFAKIQNDLKSFKKYVPTQIMDWVFIPFNFIWIYIVNLSLMYYFFILVFLVVAGSLMGCWWGLLNREDRYACRPANFKFGHSLVHIFYFLIQGVLVLSFIFSSIKGGLVYFGCLFLGIYFLSAIYLFRKIDKKIELPDWVYIIFGLLVVLGKLIYIIF